MKKLTVAAEKARAKQRRDQLNWFALGGVVLGVIAGIALAAKAVFPFLSEKYVVLGSALIGAVIGMLLHLWRVRKEPKPACPNCGHPWEIVEGTHGNNTAHFEAEGSCPKCGVPI